MYLVKYGFKNCSTFSSLNYFNSYFTFRWFYFTQINTFSELQAFTVLEELLLKKEICIAVKEKLTKDSGVAGDSIYDNIVRRLMAKPSARGNHLTIHYIRYRLHPYEKPPFLC